MGKFSWSNFLAGTSITVTLILTLVGYVVANDVKREVGDTNIREKHSSDIQKLTECINTKFEIILQRLARIEAKLDK